MAVFPHNVIDHTVLSGPDEDRLSEQNTPQLKSLTINFLKSLECMIPAVASLASVHIVLFPHMSFVSVTYQTSSIHCS